MPYATNNGTSVYYELEGTGPAIVLAHGFGADHDAWRELGYVEGLAANYTLVLTDVRGHGRSGKPYDPAAYRSSCFASDVVAVLDDAGIDRAHFFGHSMGAFIGYSVAKHAPFRLLSLALGGADPYEPDPSTVDSLKTSLEHGLAVAIAEVEAQHGPVPPRMKATALANNLHALRAALQSPREDYLPGLRIFTGSCLLYAGFMDPAYSGIQKLAEEMPGATFLSLPRLDHWSSFVSTSDILPYIRAFLRTVK